MTSRTVVRMLVVGLAVVNVASCSGSGEEIVLDLPPQEWTARGDPVDAGIVCSGGTHGPLAFLDLDGSTLPPSQGVERRIDALWAEPPDAVAHHGEEWQLVCADGSGWFTVVTEQYRNGGPWSVTGGTGAYGDLRASGTLEIERGPWEGPLAEPVERPPAGWPLRTIATGTVELSANG